MKYNIIGTKTGRLSMNNDSPKKKVRGRGKKNKPPLQYISDEIKFDSFSMGQFRIKLKPFLTNMWDYIDKKLKNPKYTKRSCNKMKKRKSI